MKINKNKYFEIFNEHLKFNKKIKDQLLNKKIEISLNDFKNWESCLNINKSSKKIKYFYKFFKFKIF